MKEIALTRGYVALVDDEDYDRVAQYKWQYCARGTGYAIHSFRQQSGKITGIYLHRFIIGAPAGSVVDHKNGNGLDNRKVNLRLATRSENNYNRKPKRNSASGYKGVHRNRSKWQAAITISGEYTILGTFNTKEEAARVYDRAARQWCGEFARLNFPDEIL